MEPVGAEDGFKGDGRQRSELYPNTGWMSLGLPKPRAIGSVSKLIYASDDGYVRPHGDCLPPRLDGVVWWLPNDPQGGSMSHCIASDVLKDLGGLHYGREAFNLLLARFVSFTRTRRQTSSSATDVRSRTLLGHRLRFRRRDRSGRLHLLTRAIMPDHVHILIRKHRDDAETMIINLQRLAHRVARVIGARDMTHPVWGGPGGRCFSIRQTIFETVTYIEKNSIKIGLPTQRWDFVKLRRWPLPQKR